ncbi:MAG: glycosyltransferase family 2 protein [Bacteroidales bacterium]
MIWAAIVILYLTFIRMLVALSNLFTMPFPGKHSIEEGPLVSVLIPARNEEENIGRLLDSLLDQQYHPFEIIVYNDSSTDATGEILRQYGAASNLVRHIDGGDLPEGWLGKNHACHRLAESATGEYLLFIDADVVAGREMLSTAVARMQEKHLSLLSVFPYQLKLTRGERVVIPVMNWILLSLLPLVLVRKCKWSSFSAANGQFMMFRASVYKRYRFHEAVRMRLAEDIIIARIMKKMRLRIETLAGREGGVSCRMYRTYREALNGFAKNVMTMFGDSRLFILFFTIVCLFGWLPVFLGAGWPGLTAYVFMVMSINISVAGVSGQNISDALLLFPERMVAFFRIVIRAFRIRGMKSYEWKERKISEIY